MQSNVLRSFLPKTILRYSVRTYSRNRKRPTFSRIPKQISKIPQNPGMQKRMNLIYKKQDVNENIDDEDFDDLETDFLGVDKVHKLHEDEIEILREKEKLLIVGRKYFKQDKINFLTWNDKEQIRHLHQTNPEEWTIEKLSEGYPALPSTIAKIITSNWKPKSEARKKNHDEHVEENWKLLKQDKLNNLPSELIEHVMKFSKRKQNALKNDEKVIINKTNVFNTPGEFGSIIENYDKLVSENKSKMKNIEEDCKDIEDKHSNIEIKNYSQKENVKDRRLITLNELKEDIENKIDKNKSIDDYEKMIIKGSSQKLNEETHLTVDAVKIGSMQTYKVKSNKLSMDKKVLDILRYPEKIVIPKQKFKKGHTYKINDCYYDDDGEFLYRVPGMD